MPPRRFRAALQVSLEISGGKRLDREGLAERLFQMSCMDGAV